MTAVHEALSSILAQPTILGLYHTRSASGFVDDSPQTHRHYVDAKLSDGHVVQLFKYQPGALNLPDQDLLGLTVTQAVRLAKSRGTIDDTGAGQPYE